MKRIMIITVMILYTSVIFGNNGFKENSDINLPFANEYSQYLEFDLNLIPDRYFYRLDCNYKYCIYDKNDVLSINQNEKGGILINYNKHMLDLTFDNGSSYTSKDTSVYIIKDAKDFYLFFDKLHFNDNKSYNLYQLTKNGIDLICSERGLIDFVGHDYIIGYKSLGIIGYQMFEFKKVFKDGKLLIDDEYKIAKTNSVEFPIWKYYTLVKSLKCEEYSDSISKRHSITLNPGTKIRSVSTDANSYITIEIDDGRKALVKVDTVDIENDDIFFVNEKKFMDYYFLDGSAYPDKIFATVFSY